MDESYFVDGTLYLTIEDVIGIHNDQITEFGGDSGLGDRPGLEGAVGQPRQTFDGKDLYSTIFAKAAVYAHSISEGQYFIDGNKRTGAVTAITFLEINSHPIPDQSMTIYDVLMDVANKKATREDVEEVLRNLCIEYKLDQK